jgi:hydroxymethylglutaryl-CoA reductase
MPDNQIIQGFSKFSKDERIGFLSSRYGFSGETRDLLISMQAASPDIQKIIEELSENTVSNYHLPFSVAPNVVVNGQVKTFPMATEESSVVAALSKAAGFWAKHGGFHAEVLGTEKKGQVHFTWPGQPEKLRAAFPEIRKTLLAESRAITAKMEQRGGGARSIELKYLPDILPGYYQLDCRFETCNAMGANFINTCLEQFAQSLQNQFLVSPVFSGTERECQILMAILSNYTPESRVRARVECPADALDSSSGEKQVAEKMVQAIQIAKNDVSRAVTHNKGIFNGIDALAIATGNDFRAIEACGHAWAARNGQYASLTDARIDNGVFRMEIDLALAVGVIGGVTAVHPLAKLAMQILEKPSAHELMMYLAVAGLASNFSAVKALVSGGIQRGHMKMHLSNILNQLAVPEKIRPLVINYFRDKTVSYSDVEDFVKTILNA